MQKAYAQNKKGILALALLSLSILLSFSFAAPSYAQTAGGYCDPNLAVYPSGHDPCCPNHSWVCPTSSSGSSAGASSGVGINTSFSCSPSSVHDFKSLIENLVVGCFYSVTIQLLIAFSVVIFLYGVFKFISSDGEDREAGKQFIIWGIVGLFVILSVMGLVAVLEGTFPLNNSTINLPQ